MNESQGTLNGLDGWAKGWILSDVDVPVSKRTQQGGCNMVSPGIVDQTVIETFKVHESEQF